MSCGLFAVPILKPRNCTAMARSSAPSLTSKSGNFEKEQDACWLWYRGVPSENKDLRNECLEFE